MVDQDRQSSVLGQICKMPEYAFLIGCVGIMSDDQRRFSPSGLRRLHMLKRRHGVVRSAPGDYRDTSRSLLDADFYDAIMFLNGHGGAFPRGDRKSTRLNSSH